MTESHRLLSQLNHYDATLNCVQWMARLVAEKTQHSTKNSSARL